MRGWYHQLTNRPGAARRVEKFFGGTGLEPHAPLREVGAKRPKLAPSGPR